MTVTYVLYIMSKEHIIYI